MTNLRSWRTWPAGSVVGLGILLGSFVGVIATMFDATQSSFGWFIAGGIFVGSLGEAVKMFFTDTGKS